MHIITCATGVIFWPYSKPLIDQACSVKMAGYWPRFLRFNGREEDYPAIMTSRLVNNAHTYECELSHLGR